MLSPPQIIPALLLAYSEIKKKNMRIVIKEYNVRALQNCTMMVTALFI